MEFKISVNMDNAAFENPAELSRILRQLAMTTEQAGGYAPDNGKLRDYNGNTVGRWEIVDD